MENGISPIWSAEKVDKRDRHGKGCIGMNEKTFPRSIGFQCSSINSIKQLSIKKFGKMVKIEFVPVIPHRWNTYNFQNCFAQMKIVKCTTSTLLVACPLFHLTQLNRFSIICRIDMHPATITQIEMIMPISQNRKKKYLLL